MTQRTKVIFVVLVGAVVGGISALPLVMPEYTAVCAVVAGAVASLGALITGIQVQKPA